MLAAHLINELTSIVGSDNITTTNLWLDLHLHNGLNKL